MTWRICLCALLMLAASASSAGTLVGHWKFDEGEGIVAHDASGHGNHGTLLSGAGWGDGFIGGALQLPGAGAYVEVPDSPSLDVTGAGLTFMAWITAPDYIQQGWIVGKGRSYQGWWMLTGADGDGIAYGLSAGGSNTRDGFYWIPPVDTWLHFCVTYDGSYIRFFIDGAVQDSVAKTGNVDANDFPLWIGRDGVITDKYFHGRIDDVRVYDGALSPIEIQAIIRNCSSGDINCNGVVNVADLTYMVNYLFKAGPRPCGY